MHNILCSERSTVSVTRDEFRCLENSEAFLGLVDNGIVSLVRSRDTQYGVRGSCFVGEAIVGDGVRLVVREKSRGALRSLLEWALPDDLRELDTPSGVADDSPVLYAYALKFVEHVGYYLRHGRRKEYRRYNEVSRFPRGRLDVAATARLRARGKSTAIAQSRLGLTADILENQLLASGLYATIEMFGHGATEDSDAVLAAREYFPLFADVDVFSYARQSLATKSRLFAEAIRGASHGSDLQVALQFARALVLHLGAWPDGGPETEIPNAYFLNLESLFQEAVFKALNSVAIPLRVVKGRSLNSPMFSGEPGRFIADPDFVLLNASKVVLCGDCKYKDVAGYPSHGDLYQLSAHCETIGAMRGILVFPGDSVVLSELGETRTGVAIGWATVRLESLESDLTTVLGRLAIRA